MVKLTEDEMVHFRFHLAQAKEDIGSINEARAEAIRRMCLETAQQTTNIEELRRVVELILERHRW